MNNPAERWGRPLLALACGPPRSGHAAACGRFSSGVQGTRVDVPVQLQVEVDMRSTGMSIPDGFPSKGRSRLIGHAAIRSFPSNLGHARRPIAALDVGPVPHGGRIGPVFQNPRLYGHQSFPRSPPVMWQRCPSIHKACYGSARNSMRAAAFTVPPQRSHWNLVMPTMPSATGPVWVPTHMWKQCKPAF